MSWPRIAARRSSGNNGERAGGSSPDGAEGTNGTGGDGSTAGAALAQRGSAARTGATADKVARSAATVCGASWHCARR